MQWLFLIAGIPYLIILLRIYSYLRKIRKFLPSGESFCSTTVVVACRNESGTISNLLQDLEVQDLPYSHRKLIFVDDRSTDNTTGIIRKFSELRNLPGPEIIHNKGKGKKEAISEGILASESDLIVTTDADCRMGISWLRSISAFSKKYNPDLIICPVSLGNSGGFLGAFQQLEFLGLQGITAGTAAGNHPIMCNGANLAFRREAYLRNSKNLRPDVFSGDDMFLLHSLKKDGSRILWLESPDALVTASPAGNIASFLRQRKRWISKGRYYKDGLTIMIGIVTFVTILAEILTLVTGFFNPLFWLVFLSLFIIKSIPDYLILYNTATRYNMKYLLKWFLPSQAAYPFYVLAVILYPERSWK